MGHATADRRLLQSAGPRLGAAAQRVAVPSAERRPRSAADVQRLRTQSRGWSDACGTLVLGRGLQELPSLRWSCSCPSRLPKVAPSTLLAESRPSLGLKAPADGAAAKSRRPHSAPTTSTAPLAYAARRPSTAARLQAKGLSDRVATAANLSDDQRTDCLERLKRLESAKLWSVQQDEADPYFTDQLTSGSSQRFGSRRSSGTDESSWMGQPNSSRGQVSHDDEPAEELCVSGDAVLAGPAGKARSVGSSMVPEQLLSRRPSAAQPESSTALLPPERSSSRPSSAARRVWPLSVHVQEPPSSRPSSAARQERQDSRPVSAVSRSRTSGSDAAIKKDSAPSIRSSFAEETLSAEDEQTAPLSARSGATGVTEACAEKMEDPWASLKERRRKPVRKVLPGYCRAIREELCRTILQYFLEHLREELALQKDQMPLSRQEVRQISEITAVPDPPKLIKYLAETEMHIKQGPQRSRILPDMPLSTHAYRRLATERRKLAELFNWGVMSKDLKDDAILGLFLRGPFTWERLQDLLSAAKVPNVPSEELEAQKRAAKWEETRKAMLKEGLPEKASSFLNVDLESTKRALWEAV